ncbi:hypothetical protein B0A48_04035 [Cryoendolithus antarcticus]|uniref:L domain-like protein n=1 Tax=Cryoendolithus antarcticus TaxID=1507870 RepID=A0A1V8TH82_9PEZI|nr:hypothetical protein B0A48_04035 [Cryoendolithus antarcticus]
MDQGREGTKVSSLPRPATRLPTRLPALTKKSVIPPATSTHDVLTTISRTTASAPPGTLRSLAKPTSSIRSLTKDEPQAAAATSRPARPLSMVTPRAATGSTSRLQAPSRRPLPPTTHEVEEHADQLGSLNGFRAASRQGFNEHEFEEHLEPIPAPPTPRQKKSSRPSLSDRTIESLQTLPTTPKERRRSSFFSIESPMGPPPRPGSAMSRTSGNGSRPSTSDGRAVKPPAVSTLRKAPASAKSASRTSISGFGFTPNGGRRAMSGSLQSSQAPPMPRTALSSPSKPVVQKSKTLSARPTKPRPGLGNVFAPPEEAPRPLPSRTVRKQPALSSDEVSSKSEDAAKSSAALRQHIAAAKAAARKHAVPSYDAAGGATSGLHAAFEPELDSNPFNAPKDEKHMLRNRINGARMTGKLNIAAMSLKAIPDEVMHMFDPDSMEAAKVNWAEVVDLTKFIAADNELEVIDDSVFPDIAPDAFNINDEDSQGNQFGGLETLDLHGNSLSIIPLGLRRLERLTSLNLTHNKLDHGVFTIISEMATLKDLKLGHNNLAGHLSVSLGSLKSLEVLDLQSNRILELPDSLRELESLRVLNLAGNQLTTLPMESLHDLPLVDLDASSNALIGSLFPLGGVSEHASLRSLSVANNSLAALTFAEAVHLPQLRSLDVTNNHLTALPTVQDWTELTTLNVGDNKVTELPAGFTSLEELRNVNFSNNDLRVIPPEVAKMENLTTLILSANPLRDKKYLTMAAADIKRDLLSRLEPEVLEDHEVGPSSDGEIVNGRAFSGGPSSGKWTLKPNGILDLSNQDLTISVNDNLHDFFTGEIGPVRQINLQGNKITRIPTALSMASGLRVVDLSNNPLDTCILFATLEMHNLTELRLRSTRLGTLAHVLEHLQAPSLQSLDVSANRLHGPLPRLREYFPSFTTLLASDNKFDSVSADALRGLHTVNLASNSLSQLPAEIGLLWDEGLKNFEVGSNLFRVPGYLVLQKGTEATLRWLRDRVPVAPRIGGESDLD